MDIMQTSPVAEKDHECFYCSQRYPSERDLSIHEYIHGSYVRDAIFNLTIQPRNSYLVYEDFSYVCGRMKSGILFKEIGSAETPEQDRIESPNKNEFDAGSCSKNLSSCHRLVTSIEFEEKPSMKTESNKSLNDLFSRDMEIPKLDEKASNKEEYEKSSNSLPFQHLTTPHRQDQASYRKEFGTDLFAYKTFEGVYSMESAEDVEILKALTENILMKYETFPTRRNSKPRDKWADRYKNSLLISEEDGRGDGAMEYSSSNWCGSAINLESSFEMCSEPNDIHF